MRINADMTGVETAVVDVTDIPAREEVTLQTPITMSIPIHTDDGGIKADNGAIELTRVWRL